MEVFALQATRVNTMIKTSSRESSFFIVNEITVDQGEKVKLTYFWTATSGSYATSYKVQKNAKLYWIDAEELTDGEANVKDEWKNSDFGGNSLVTDSNGVVTLNTAKLKPGTYYIGALDGFTDGGQADDAGFVSAGSETGPAFFKLTVKAYNGKLGDVDGDTRITTADATAILRYVAKLTKDINDSIADVDGDNKVTTADATTILRYVAKLITTFPAEK